MSVFTFVLLLFLLSLNRKADLCFWPAWRLFSISYFCFLYLIFTSSFDLSISWSLDLQLGDTKFISALLLYSAFFYFCVCFSHKTTWVLYDQASRSISTGQLHALLHFHLQPINVVDFNKPLGTLRFERSHLEASFPLRCFQRLSFPYLATRQCHWHDNRYTSGSSIPVLSY